MEEIALSKFLLKSNYVDLTSKLTQMSGSIIIDYRDWKLEVDKASTLATYQTVQLGGAKSCGCANCQNYWAYQDYLFPNDIMVLMNQLGVDYRKPVEITYWDKLTNGLHRIGGWFHFKGKIVEGPDCKVPARHGGFDFELVKINDNFDLGFSTSKDLTYFEEDEELVQIEFMANIPWVINKTLEDT